MIPIADVSDVLLQLGLASSVTEEERAFAVASLKRSEAAVRRHLRFDPTYQEVTEYYPQATVSPNGGIGVWEVDDQQAYFRNLSGAGTEDLQLRRIPVRSITSLYIDYDGRSGSKGTSFSGDAKTEGTDYWPNYTIVDSDGNKVCEDGLIRSHGLWPTETGSIKITYYGGYKEAELRGDDSLIDASPIFEAVVDEAVRRFIRINQHKKRTLAGFSGPLTSESLGEYSYSADGALLARIVGGADLMQDTIDKIESFVNYGYMMGGG